jgi:hypothetical protein
MTTSVCRYRSTVPDDTQRRLHRATWATERHDKVPDPQWLDIRLVEGCCLESLRLQKGKIGGRIASDQRGFEVCTAGLSNVQAIVTLDHMMRGDDFAGLRPQDARGREPAAPFHLYDRLVRSFHGRGQLSRHPVDYLGHLRSSRVTNRTRRESQMNR